MHDSAIAELAEHLRQLVQAVTPFLHLFPEIELQCWFFFQPSRSPFDHPSIARLQRVLVDTELSLSRVSTNTTHGNVLPQGSVTAK